MKLYGALPAVLLTIVGCGGSNASSGVASLADTSLPELGRSTLNLSIDDIGGAAREAAIAGTGTDRGRLTIGDTAGVLQIDAALGRIASNERLGQTLTVHLAHPEALAVGSTILLNGTTNTLEYHETSTAIEGPVAGDGFSQIWHVTGGSVEVTALSSTEMTLQFTNVQLSVGSGLYTYPIEISGTLTGSLS